MLRLVLAFLAMAAPAVAQTDPLPSWNDSDAKTAILDFDMRLGEGSGAALALGIVRSALACHNGMATFADAGIDGA